MQGLLVEVNWGTSVICISVGLAWIIKQISNVLKFTLQQKCVEICIHEISSLIHFAVLKLLILKEEKRSCTLLVLLFIISSGSPFFYPCLTTFCKCNGLILFP